MSKTRLEAFSDGVLAIVITIMVLELKVPRGNDLAALRPVIPGFVSYVLSFVFVGIYWSNHHHLIQVAERVDGTILWANLHLLFWLSLTPVTTGWIGAEYRSAWPVAAYGLVLLFSGGAYLILVMVLFARHARDSALAKAIGRDRKGKLSLAIYASAVPLAFVNTWLSCALYLLVAIIWLVPDRRIERAIAAPS